jgi:hypothetical protein
VFELGHRPGFDFSATGQSGVVLSAALGLSFVLEILYSDSSARAPSPSFGFCRLGIISSLTQFALFDFGRWTFPPWSHRLISVADPQNSKLLFYVRRCVCAGSSPRPWGSVVAAPDFHHRQSVDSPRFSAVRSSSSHRARLRLVLPVHPSRYFFGEGFGRERVSVFVFVFGWTESKWCSMPFSELCEYCLSVTRRWKSVLFFSGQITGSSFSSSYSLSVIDSCLRTEGV